MTGLAWDQVYTILRDKIERVVYEPGKPLSAFEVAKEFGVSRTPVQTAFAKLAVEGYVTIIPQRGTYVSKIDINKMVESVSLRLMVEQAVVHVFCNFRSEAAMTELENNVHQQLFYLEKDDDEKLYQLDQEFHFIIYRASGYEYSKQVLSEASFDQNRFRQLKLNTRVRKAETVCEHKEIFEAIEKREANKAAYLSAMHIIRFGSDIESIYKRLPNYFENGSGQIIKKFEIEERKLYVLKNQLNHNK